MHAIPSSSVRDPAELIQFAALDLDVPVLIEALDGFVDAGHAVRLSREHLLTTFESEVVVTFDVDELLDHRERRPLLLFDTDHWDSYQPPSLAVHLLRDADGTSFLVLAGPEPDLQWERFIAAALLVVERLNVQLTIGLHGVPWQAPHTRPIAITAHGRPRELLTTPPLGIGRVQVPASVGHLLEYRLGSLGRSTIGFAAQSPTTSRCSSTHRRRRRCSQRPSRRPGFPSPSTPCARQPPRRRPASTRRSPATSRRRR